jgi:hypothetical protein
MPHYNIKIKIVTTVIQELYIFNILERIVDYQMNWLVPAPGKRGEGKFAGTFLTG